MVKYFYRNVGNNPERWLYEEAARIAATLDDRVQLSSIETGSIQR
jgi:hypothetical protein